MALSIPIITEYVGTGLDKFRKELSQAETSSQKAGLLIKKAFIPATAAIGGLAAAALDSAKAAMEDEAQQKLLASQLRKTTGATDKQIEATEDYIGKQLRLKGFTDSQLRPAFEKLARATGDLEQAQRLTNTAMDIATATGKPLETVVASLEKAYGGNMGAIQRLLPEYREMIKEGGTFEEVMGKIEEKLGGAASEAALTAEARFRILKEQLGETQEEIGYALIPVLERVLPFLQDLADWAQENPDKFKNIALAIGAIAASTVALNIAMATNPYVAAAAGIVAMALAFEHLYNEVSKINKIGGLAARVLGFVFGGASGRLGSMLKISDLIYDAVLPGGGNSGAGGAGSGLRGGLMQELKGIPAMADGGIVTGPTLALIGEAGPEAVVPLDRMGGMGNNVTIHVNGGDPRAVVDALRKYMQTHGAVPIRIGGA
jgi:hypothetical protein